MDPFWDKLMWMVVDKVLLAGVGALIAYIAARSLEQYRRDQAMVLELGKLRAQAFARLMSLLGEHHAFLVAFAGGIDRTERDLWMSQSHEHLARFRTDMRITIPREVALLDPSLRDRIKDYVDALYSGIDLRKVEQTPLTSEELAAWTSKLRGLRDAVMEVVPRIPRH